MYGYLNAPPTETSGRQTGPPKRPAHIGSGPQSRRRTPGPITAATRLARRHRRRDRRRRPRHHMGPRRGPTQRLRTTRNGRRTSRRGTHAPHPTARRDRPRRTRPRATRCSSGSDRKRVALDSMPEPAMRSCRHSRPARLSTAGMRSRTHRPKVARMTLEELATIGVVANDRREKTRPQRRRQLAPQRGRRSIVAGVFEALRQATGVGRSVGRPQ